MDEGKLTARQSIALAAITAGPILLCEIAMIMGWC